MANGKVSGSIGKAAVDSAFAAVRTVPDDAGVALERDQLFLAKSPVGGLVDGDVIARFAAGAGGEQGAGDVQHGGGMAPLIGQRRAADGAEAAGRRRVGEA